MADLADGAAAVVVVAGGLVVGVVRGGWAVVVVVLTVAEVVGTTLVVVGVATVVGGSVDVVVSGSTPPTPLPAAATIPWLDAAYLSLTVPTEMAPMISSPAVAHASQRVAVNPLSPSSSTVVFRSRADLARPHRYRH